MSVSPRARIGLLVLLCGLGATAQAQTCPAGSTNSVANLVGQSSNNINANTVYVGNSRLQLAHVAVSAMINQNAINDAHISGDVGIRIGHNGSATNPTSDYIESTYDFRNPENLGAYLPVSNLTFRLHDVDAGDNLIVNAYDQSGGLISLTGSSIYSFASATIVSYAGSNRFTSPGTDVGDLRGSVYFDFAGYQVSRIVLRYYDTDSNGTYTTAGWTACNPSLTLYKTTLGGTGGTFGFTLSNTGRNTGSTVSTSAANTPTQVDGSTATGMQGFSITTPGSAITVTETTPLPTGWTFTGTTCRNAAGTTVGSATGATYTVPGAATGAGAAITCTVTNTALPRLTLVKTVTNDHGGTQVATAWILSAAGPTPISGITGSATVTSAVVTPGTYTLSESATPTGYTASTYSCIRNGGAAVVSNSIALVAGDTATCTINNNDSNATDVSIAKTASSGTVASDGQVTFTLQVRNLGIAAAHGAVVRDPVAAGLDCTAAGLPAPTCSATPGSTCPSPLTAAGLQAGIAVPILPNAGVITIGLTCRVTASGF